MKKLIILIIVYICIVLSNPLNIKNEKTYGLNHIPNNYVQPFTIINSQDDLVKVNFPCIFKPNICSGGNKNVETIHNIKEAIRYFKNINGSVIAQKIHNGSYEVGVLYERHPFLKNGKIVSIVSKNIDNKWKPLKCSHYGNNSGTRCNNKPTWITKKLENKIDFISKNIPNFYVGRYDIRFNDINKFKEGKEFKVLELNGTMGFDLRARFRTLNPIKFIIFLLLIVRWIIVRVIIGFQNIILFNTPNPIKFIKNMINMYFTAIKCKDWEFIFRTSVM